MVFLSNILLLAATAIAAPAADVERRGGENCLSDIIVSRGLEKPQLERRASWSYEGESGVDHWETTPSTALKTKVVNAINISCCFTAPLRIKETPILSPTVESKIINNLMS
ncbi:UNVERIFIED_CONTAM: hypothetical protein HDU68_000568 [Siphonaria sp. JEL0065]|nr:hypothetical protein HDU68_000568 [Siphonaria sp. JEL0065]